MLPLLLFGCLPSINHPLVGPDGTVALFLGDAGEFNLLLEQGSFHLLRDGALLALPLTAGSGSSAALDWHPEGQEFLYVRNEIDDWLEIISSTLYRVAADPEAEPVVVYTSELTIRDAAFRADGTIVLLEQGDDVAGRLSILDPSTGDQEDVSDEILGFRQDAARETLYLLAVDESGFVAIGAIGPWGPEHEDSQPLAVFTLTGGMLESFFLLDDDFFWDIDPTGKHLALAVYDDVMLVPKVENEVPTLFFIEDGERLTKIADAGYMPVFSPDGRYLAYIGTVDGDTGQAMLYEPRTLDTHPVPATQGATTCFWLADDQLGVAIEGDNDDYRIMVYNFSNGEFTRLID